MVHVTVAVQAAFIMAVLRTPEDLLHLLRQVLEEQRVLEQVQLTEQEQEFLKGQTVE